MNKMKSTLMGAREHASLIMDSVHDSVTAFPGIARKRLAALPSAARKRLVALPSFIKRHIVSLPSDVKAHWDDMLHGAETPQEKARRTVKHGLLLLGQLALIMGVYGAGCALAAVLPITLPGNIVGMVLLLVLLGTHILKTQYVSEACNYLIDNMSIFFIPAGVAILGCVSLLQGAAAKFAFVCIITTIIVFLATSYTVVLVSWLMAKAAKRKAATTKPFATSAPHPAQKHHGSKTKEA